MTAEKKPFSQWFDDWRLKGIKIKAGFADFEWGPQKADEEAAWDMYVELLTRITTQPLADGHGVERTALQSIHALFPITREILKAHGRDCAGFARIAIIILNQVVRPFTAKWHGLDEAGAFDDPRRRREFRVELRALQKQLRAYTWGLAEIARVEDLDVGAVDAKTVEKVRDGEH